LIGEEVVTRESLVSICWRLIPYYLNNWEQQVGPGQTCLLDRGIVAITTVLIVLCYGSYNFKSNLIVLCYSFYSFKSNLIVMCYGSYSFKSNLIDLCYGSYSFKSNQFRSPNPLTLTLTLTLVLWP